MYKTTNFDSLNYFQKRQNNLNMTSRADGVGFKAPNENIRLMVDRLVANNQELTDQLHRQKQKNYELIQLKRRLEQDIQRLTFELDRIGMHENLFSRQMQFKKIQIVADTNKMNAQLNNYLQQNKSIRAELRKVTNQCVCLAKQKEDLVTQNITLLGQISHLSNKLSISESQNKQYIKIITMHERNNQQIKINTEKSEQGYDVFNNGTQQKNSIVFSSPQIKAIQSKHQISTNISLPKNGLLSPDLLKNRGIQDKQFNINRDFYEEDNQMSIKSFSNKMIRNNFQQSSISPLTKAISASNLLNNRHTQQSKKSPQVFPYANRQSPMVQMLKFNQENQQVSEKDSKHLPNLNYNQNASFLQTYQKAQLKDQVAGLRNEMVDQLITKYYCKSLQVAEKQKSNSLKYFINELSPKINTLYKMVLNYMQARSMLAQSCPTLRLKWQPINPIINNLSLNPELLSSGSDVMHRNTIQIAKVYQSIKQNAKKEKTVIGQYLALFRLLTLLGKIQTEGEKLLVQCIKHSALKQIYRIKKYIQGKPEDEQQD